MLPYQRITTTGHLETGALWKLMLCVTGLDAVLPLG